MISAWKERLTTPPDGFPEFLELFKAWIADKTSDPVRLSAKIGRLWSNLTKDQKKAYTSQLQAHKVLEPFTEEVLFACGGHIDSFEAYKWKRTL